MTPNRKSQLLAGMVVATLCVQSVSCADRDRSEVAPRDVAAVEATFAAYRDAVAADEGAAAAEWVSEATLRHAARLRDLALDATRAELEAEEVGSEMHVLMLRLHATPEELEAADPRGAFALGVERGLVSNLWKPHHELRDLRFEEGEAALVAGRFAKDYEIGAPLRFVREGDRWKLDLMPEFERLSALMEANAKQLGVDPHDLARARIEIYSTKTLAPRHLEPYRSPRAG